MTNLFDAKVMNDSLRGYYDLRRNCPYSVKTWVTNSSAAIQCGKLMEKIKEQLSFLVDEINAGSSCYKTGYEIKISQGAGIFPKRPWIGILAPGEKLTDGVYPIFSFGPNADGFLIGCVDSVANPQTGFSLRCCYGRSELATAKEIDGKLRPLYDRHLAKGAVWFDATEDVLERKLKESIVSAIKVWREFRKNKTNLPSHEQWVKKLLVDNIQKWVHFVSDKCKCAHQWAFRGQGNEAWGLSSSFERLFRYKNDRIDDGKAEELFLLERESLFRFKRESAKELNYRGLGSADLIALMQHYGGRTRMLDFSWSPAVALYMAIEQYETAKMAGVEYPQLAIWAIDTGRIVGNMNWVEYLKRSAAEANLIFDSLQMKSESDSGVLLVLPSVNNLRLAAQEGLFLMPKDLRCGLQENLASIFNTNETAALSYNVEKLSGFSNHKDAQYSAFKFVFDSEIIFQAKNVLKAFGVTSKSMYPDLQGLARFCSPKFQMGVVR